MKLFLTSKVKSIDIVNIVNTLLNEYVKNHELNNDYKDTNYLKNINQYTDYVRDFLTYYFNDFPIELDKDARTYVLNRLYAVKGGLEVFNVLNELLSIEIPGESQYNVDLGLKCEYEFPNLNILDIDDLHTSNISEFIKKLKNMLNVLLFYKNFKSIIRNIYLLIKNTLKDYEFISIKPYFVHKLNFIE